MTIIKYHVAAMYIFSMPFSISLVPEVSEALTLIACFEEIPNAI